MKELPTNILLALILFSGCVAEYEYKTISVPDTMIERTANTMAGGGWELVETRRANYAYFDKTDMIFKRRK